MKRDNIAILLHPYKNRLIPRSALKDSVERFVTKLLSLSTDHPHLRFNLVMPGYILETVNTLLLSSLRELHKKGVLEWILTGYTEPFLSLSPADLTKDNIVHGMRIFSELTGETPAGFLPPFSNWEPSFIDLLRKCNLGYAVLSRDQLPSQTRTSCGYWMAEYAGNSLPLIASDTIYHPSAPADFKGWVDQIFAQDKLENQQSKFLTLQYMVPLYSENETDPFRWLSFAASEIDKHLLAYQPVRFSDHIRSTQPLGLQYIPSSIRLEPKEQLDLHFFNYLYSFDQIGILQRKLLEVSEQLHSIEDTRLTAPLLRQLFFVQDINRLLPGKENGFENLNDRLWSYSRLIDIENALHQYNDVKGGQIRVTDFLRNGSKSIILSNRALKAYIDHVNGGSIFEFDFRERSLNLCAAYNPSPHQPPNITAAGNSRTWFLDRMLSEEIKFSDLLNGNYKDLGNFMAGQFEYKVRKTNEGVKVNMVRHGSIIRGEKACPLNLEKVFGLEQDGAVLSFVYQLSNPSLMTYSFKFSTQLTFSLQGLPGGEVRMQHGTETIEKLGWELTGLQSLTRWNIVDRISGVKLYFQTQKPLDVCFFPQSQSECSGISPQGLTAVLSCNVNLEPSSQWKLIGKITFRKLRKKGEDPDAV
ncbi:MAG: DUF1926 domain-containing protein [Fibrobacter sp.]|nr:DUF1926 domain-containing protein [Fibrobacter sp.]